jgi:hypothetical protein
VSRNGSLTDGGVGSHPSTEWLTAEQVADRLGRAVDTLKHYQKDGRLTPEHVLVHRGRAVVRMNVYSRRQVDTLARELRQEEAQRKKRREAQRPAVVGKGTNNRRRKQLPMAPVVETRTEVRDGREFTVTVHAPTHRNAPQHVNGVSTLRRFG